MIKGGFPRCSNVQSEFIGQGFDSAGSCWGPLNVWLRANPSKYLVDVNISVYYDSFEAHQYPLYQMYVLYTTVKE